MTSTTCDVPLGPQSVTTHEFGSVPTAVSATVPALAPMFGIVSRYVPTDERVCVIVPPWLSSWYAELGVDDAACGWSALANARSLPAPAPVVNDAVNRES